MISISIDVTKIDKVKLFKGEKGTYLDAVLIDTPNNTYGNDFMIVQSVSMEERALGVKGEILGNGKIIVRKEQPKESPTEPTSINDITPPPENDSGFDDLPF